MANVSKTVEIDASDIIVNNLLKVGIHAKKFKTVGKSIQVCEGKLSLAKFMQD